MSARIARGVEPSCRRGRSSAWVPTVMPSQQSLPAKSAAEPRLGMAPEHHGVEPFDDRDLEGVAPESRDPRRRSAARPATGRGPSSAERRRSPAGRRRRADAPGGSRRAAEFWAPRRSNEREENETGDGGAHEDLRGGASNQAARTGAVEAAGGSVQVLAFEWPQRSAHGCNDTGTLANSRMA